MPKLLPPNPDNQNEDRADWAMTAINAFREEAIKGSEHLNGSVVFIIMVILTRDDQVILQGTFTPSVHAHAGCTQMHAADPLSTTASLPLQAVG
jgi:hypothetical protein